MLKSTFFLCSRKYTVSNGNKGETPYVLGNSFHRNVILPCFLSHRKNSIDSAMKTEKKRERRDRPKIKFLNFPPLHPFESSTQCVTFLLAILQFLQTLSSGEYLMRIKL